jgi:hypothetical protein
MADPDAHSDRNAFCRHRQQAASQLSALQAHLEIKL